MATSRAGWSHFVIDEMRAYPGRWNVTLRCLLACAVTIVASMTFGVPLLAVSLFLVFFATQSNVVMTEVVSAGIFIGMLVAFALVLPLLMWTLDRPALRLVVLALLLAGALYMMRASKIGPMFYLVGLALASVQPYLDFPVPPELMLRAVLWAFVAALYPLALCLVINTVLLPGEPLAALKVEAHRRLRQVEGVIERASGGASRVPPPEAAGLQQGLLAAYKLLRFAWMRSRAVRRQRARHLATVTAIQSLYGQALELERTAHAELLPDDGAALQAALRRLDDCIQRGVPFDLAGIDAPALDGAGPAGAMWRALRRLADATGHAAPAPANQPKPAKRVSLMADDAFTNPAYLRYALKTVLAMLLGYLFVVATDWRGISTVVVTCLIVAQPSLGASNHKIKLRVAGAAAGSVLALLLAVFTVPRIDDIVGLLLITLPVLGLCAYVSAGSERIAYAGQQMMFTFALALLMDSGPSTDLTSIRDRLIGIALGIAISCMIQTMLWPERENRALAHRLAALMRALAVRLSAAVQADTDHAATERLWTDFNACEETVARVALEPNWQQGEGEHEVETDRVQGWLGDLRELMLALDRLDDAAAAQPGAAGSVQQRALAQVREQTAQVLRSVASGLDESGDVFLAPQRGVMERWAVAVAALIPFAGPPDVQAGLRRMAHSVRALARGEGDAASGWAPSGSVA